MPRFQDAGILGEQHDVVVKGHRIHLHLAQQIERRKDRPQSTGRARCGGGPTAHGSSPVGTVCAPVESTLEERKCSGPIAVLDHSDSEELLGAPLTLRIGELICEERIAHRRVRAGTGIAGENCSHRRAVSLEIGRLKTGGKVSLAGNVAQLDATRQRDARRRRRQCVSKPLVDRSLRGNERGDMFASRP